MNLHRTSNKPQWKKVHPSTYKFFQKLAAATNGIVTPANLITVVGLGLVMYGLLLVLQEHFLLGIILVGLGRLFDIFDGAVAEVTRTKSPLGEICDAVADKIGTLLTIAVLFIAQIAAWWIILALIIPQGFISILIFYKRNKGIGVHPTLQGKLSMATAWVGILGLLATKAAGDIAILVVIAYGCIAASFVLGLYALWQYGTGRD